MDERSSWAGSVVATSSFAQCLLHFAARRAPLALGVVTLALLAAVPSARADADADLIAKGQYLAIAADCMPCHSGPGMKPFSGGLPLDTPFGMLMTPNITPDKATGIGSWTDDQFYAAVHDGIGHDGEDLYPVMPYTSYTKVTRDDVMAIKAYLFSLEPVDAPLKPSAMEFPFNIRSTLGVWRELFFHEGTFEPDPKATVEVNRGAYLVEALGHCGECHTPRNVMGAMEPSQSLRGAAVDNWFAPDISSDLRSGIGGKTDAQLVQFLKTGASKSEGTVFGAMGEVVHDSLSKLTDDDLNAIVAYLKTTPAEPSETAGSSVDPTQAEGAVLYLNTCASCHQPKGRGIAGAVPALAGNPAVRAALPNDVISAVLNGIPAQGNYSAMPSFAESYTDAQVAEIANYVRTAWGNTAGANATASLVTSLRAQSSLPASGTEAARALGCPLKSPVGSDNLLGDSDPEIVALMNDVDPTTVGSRAQRLVLRMKQNNPGIGDGDIVDNLLAAYCPVVASSSQLAMTEKRNLLNLFIVAVQRSALAGIAAAEVTETKVLVSLPIAPSLLTKVEAAAVAAKLARDAWIDEALSKAVGGK